MYAGVDGCKKGWVGFVLPGQRLVEGCTSFADMAGQLADLGVTTIGVDMPIGPPQTALSWQPGSRREAWAGIDRLPCTIATSTPSSSSQLSTLLIG